MALHALLLRPPLEPWELLLRRKSLRRDYQPTNLCRYFWTIVGLTLLWAVAALLTGILFLVIAPLMWLGFWIHDRHQARRKRLGKKEKPKKEKRPGLVRSFVKAKKQKVCPMIEVVDSSDE